MNGNNLLKNGNFVSAVRYAGLATALLFALYIIWNLLGNHLTENTEALMELKGSIDRSNEIDEKQVEVMQKLETLIEIKLE